MGDFTKPRFIAVEGIDGSGKSTQAKILCKKLESLGAKAVFDFEPTDRRIGKLIREILAGSQKADPRTVALLFAADRLEHVTDKNGILENLKNGVSVVSDRYYFSSYAYQKLDMPLSWVMEINKWAKQLARPDICLFIDVPIDVCLERIYKNRQTTSDIFENEQSLTAARNNFLEVFEKTKNDENIVIVDGSGSLQEVADRVFEAVKPLYL